jgi:hypothetical protein
MGDYSRPMMPVSERIDGSTSRVPRRLAVATTVVQLYLVSSYLVMAALPYFWRDLTMAAWMDDPVGRWVLAVPALLLGYTGFWVTVFGPTVATISLVGGTMTAVVHGRWLTKRVLGWLIAATVLSLAFLAFSLTPLAEDIRIWVLD